MRPSIPLDLTEKDEQRFWSKVDRKGDEECWPWTGTRLPNGYGRFRISNPRSTPLAHRVAYRIAHGRFPVELQVHHHCDDPGCVNPRHLWLGDQRANVWDARRKGRRGDVGASNNRAVLSRSEVVEIRKIAAAGVSQSRIAEIYGVSQQNVSAIVRRETWAEI